MRLYFTDGAREIGFDTEYEVWTDENDVDFMHGDGWPHIFIEINTEAIETIDKMLDFNKWTYSRGLMPPDAEPEGLWWTVTFTLEDGTLEEMDFKARDEKHLKERVLAYMRAENENPNRKHPEYTDFEIEYIKRKEGDTK